MLWLAVWCVVAVVGDVTLRSTHLEVNVTTSGKGLSHIRSLDGTGGLSLSITDDWSVVVNSVTLTSSVCTFERITAVGSHGASALFTCSGNCRVTVEYMVHPDWWWVSKQLVVNCGGSVTVGEVDVWSSLATTTKGSCTEQVHDVVPATNPYFTTNLIALFVRCPKQQQGLYATVMNGFLTGNPLSKAAPLPIRVGYTANDPGMGDYKCDPGLLGLYRLSKYKIPGSPLLTSERDTFRSTVASYLMDKKQRQKATVKVNVAWDENDYQIDISSAHGWAQYQRIITRNQQFGVPNVVYAPRNTKESSRTNATDAWRWEEILWMSMGERLRTGQWDPVHDDMPPEVQQVLDFAKGKDIRLLTYMYPIMGFLAPNATWVFKCTQNRDGYCASLGDPAFQAWLIERMAAFLKKTGEGGWAFDYTFFRDTKQSTYTQWKGWNNVFNTIRAQFPDIVMDHRQTSHRWGPWGQLGGSYTEPIAGDENPESYGVGIPSIHVDVVAGDHTRSINWLYHNEQLQPVERIPGFIFHQTERSNITGGMSITDLHLRDFDYLGYRYSMMATFATAGLNNVLTMIPARDELEFQNFPAADIAWVKEWLQWTDTNIEYLQNTRYIKGPPEDGKVDVTSAIVPVKDEGYIFCFNPGYQPLQCRFTLDEAIGISNASRGASFDLSEVYPVQGHKEGTWHHGQTVNAMIPANSVRLLEVRKTKKDGDRPRVRGIACDTVQWGEDPAVVVMEGCQGVQGTTHTVRIVGVTGHPPTNVRVNGVLTVPPVVTRVEEGDGGASWSVRCEVRFAGTPVIHAMPISPTAIAPANFTGGTFEATFTIPEAIQQQLKERAATYPLPWTADDRKVSWLDPNRLLLYPRVTNPPLIKDFTIEIDGKAVPFLQAYTSREVPNAKCFVGYYYDASALTAGEHRVSVTWPKLSLHQFQGYFWENLETVYSGDVV